MRDLVDGLTTIAHHPGVSAYLIGAIAFGVSVLLLCDAAMRGRGTTDVTEHLTAREVDALTDEAIARMRPQLQADISRTPQLDSDPFTAA